MTKKIEDNNSKVIEKLICQIEDSLYNLSKFTNNVDDEFHDIVNDILDMCNEIRKEL